MGRKVVKTTGAEHKQAEEALRESERFNTSLLTNSPHPIIVINPDTSVRYVNPTLEALTGFSSAELFGVKAPYPWWTEETLQKTSMDLKESMSKGARRLEELFQKRNGERFWVEISSTPVTKDGQLEYYLASWIDITERKQAEEALRESEERFRSLVEATSDWIWEIDANATYTYASPKIKELLGYEPDEVVGKTPFDLMPPEEAKRVAAEFAAITEARRPFSRLENLNLHKDGRREVTLETSGVPIFDANGNWRGYRGVDRDITERKQMERKYTAAIEATPDGFWMADLEGRIVDVNDAYCRMLGYSREELLAMSIDDLKAPGERGQYRKKMSEQGYHRFETRHRAKDGEIIDVEASGIYLDVEGGRFVVFIRDITERSQAEEALLDYSERLEEMVEERTRELQDTELRYRTLFEQAPDAIVLIDPESGELVEFNDRAHQSLGYTRDEFNDLQIADFEAIESPAEVTRHLEKIVREGADTFETIHRTKGGEIRSIEVSARALAIGGRDFVQSVWRDATEQKVMQEKLLASERLATLGKLSGSISHELRNPLGVIDTSAYYLKTKLKDGDKKVQQHLARIRSAVGNATAIIESLLNLTRMKEPRTERLDLIAVASDVIAASEVPATVNVIQDSADAEVLVDADHEQLLMAFQNIVTNAIDAMEGRGTLTVTVRKTADGEAEVSFADTGPGIAAENLGKVFQPLFSTKARGIGFGLSIAKLVVDRHGGTIQAKSEPGKGAIIIIRLPSYVNTGKEA